MKVAISVKNRKNTALVSMAIPRTGLLCTGYTEIKPTDQITIAEFFNTEYSAGIDITEFNGDSDLGYYRICAWLGNAFSQRTSDKFTLTFTLDLDTRDITFNDVVIKGVDTVIEQREQLMRSLNCSNLHGVDYDTLASNFQSDLWRFLNSEIPPEPKNQVDAYLERAMSHSKTLQENVAGKYVIITKRMYMVKLYLIPILVGSFAASIVSALWR